MSSLSRLRRWQHAMNLLDKSEAEAALTYLDTKMHIIVTL